MNTMLTQPYLIVYGLGVGFLLLAGILCMIISRNLIRILIGLELLTKAVTVLIMLGGYLTGKIALAQSIIVTLIIIEVVVIVVAAGVVIGAHRHNDSLDTRLLKNLQG